jgi:hypothetical protein
MSSCPDRELAWLRLSTLFEILWGSKTLQVGRELQKHADRGFHELREREASAPAREPCIASVQVRHGAQVRRRDWLVRRSFGGADRARMLLSYEPGGVGGARLRCTRSLDGNAWSGTPRRRPRRRLQDELIRLGRYPLLVIDEVGYIPFEPEAANLFLQLVCARYERASLIVTSNKPFGRWGEVFGDEVVAAMIDRLVHHAEVIALKGDSYRLKDRDLGRITPTKTDD